MELSPTDITAEKSAGKLIITWNNGEKSTFPFDLLRNACPCAQCRGGHENMSSEPEDDMLIIPLLNINTVTLDTIEIVGGYAIQLFWADGHKHGIYNWQYLFSLWEKSQEIDS